MKKCVLIFLLLPILAWSQTNPPLTLYEVVPMKAKPGQEKAFETAVKAHNQQFHADGTHQAVLLSNINGPEGGAYSWIMGPMNWAAMDNRPSGDAHDDDWANNVGQHTESIGSPQYWNGDPKNSQVVQNPQNTKSTVWMYDLKPGKSAQWAELIGKVKKVYAEKRPTESMLVAWNAFSNADGQDAVLIFPFANWASLDDQRDFGVEFEAVHGAGTWHNFLNHVSECVKGRVDWMRTTVE